MPQQKTNVPEWQASVAEEIRRAKEFHSPWLRLANSGLTDIPEELFEFTDVQSIDLSNNQLTRIPERLWTLPSLRQVTLLGNPIKTLPNRKGLTIDLPTYLRCTNVNNDDVTLAIGPSTTQKDVDAFAAGLATGRKPKRLLVGQ